MRSRLLKLGLLLFVTVQVVSAQAPGADFDAYVNKALKDWEVPGIAIAIVKNDRVVLAKGYGVRELNKSEPVDERTLFAIGSSSKAFTATAIAILVDQAKLKWEDPATKYLPGLQLFDPYTTRELTVADLMTHRSGLTRGDQLWYASDYSRDEVLRRVRYLKPSWSFRSRFGYQNIMFLAAGQIIPSVTGKSWDDFVRERIFVPLDMKSTNTSIKAFAGVTNVATPHSRIEDKVQVIPWRNIDNIAPAGSINSNVQDMAQWVRLQLGEGVYDGKRVLSSASIKEIQTPQTIIRLDGPRGRLYPEAHFLTYGLGWFLSDYRGRKLVEHGGAIDGMRAEVALMPEEKVGLVILSNLNGTILPHALMYRIFDFYLNAPARDWSSEFLKSSKELENQAKTAEKKTESERVKGTSPSLPLEKYVGTFQSEMYGETRVSLEKQKLIIRFGPSFTGELEHWHFDTFRVTWRDPTQSKDLVSFKLNMQGKVESVNIENLSEFTRVPESVSKVASTP